MSKEIYEIERKFLVKEITNNLQQYKCYKIKQGYISTNPTIRLRQRDNEYILTIKSSGIMKKLEYELPITEEQFNNLWHKVEGNAIEKNRYLIPLKDDLIAELDIYGANLSNFANVEVEFNSTKDAILFTPPDWFGQEVTQNNRYSNASLAKYGLPSKK